MHMYNWVNVLSIKNTPGSIFIFKCPPTNQTIPVYYYLDFCGDQTEIVMTQSNVLCSHKKFVSFSSKATLSSIKAILKELENTKSRYYRKCTSPTHLQKDIWTQIEG